MCSHLLGGRDTSSGGSTTKRRTEMLPSPLQAFPRRSQFSSQSLQKSGRLQETVEFLQNVQDYREPPQSQRNLAPVGNRNMAAAVETVTEVPGPSRTNSVSFDESHAETESALRTTRRSSRAVNEVAEKMMMPYMIESSG